MKRVLSLFMILILLVGTMSTGFADSGSGTFEAGDHTELKVTGNNIGAEISFNGSGSFSNSGVNYEFSVIVPYDEDELVLELFGETQTGLANLRVEGSVLEGYLDPSSTSIHAIYIISRENLYNGQIFDSNIKWYFAVDPDDFDDSGSQQMVAHMELTVYLEPEPTYDLTVGIEGEGTTTPVVGTHPYDDGTIVDLVASPASGWHFVNWTGDSVADSGDPTTTIEMTTDASVTAVFERCEYELLVDHTGMGSTDPDGTSGPVYEDVVDLTATPDTGWHFVNWTGDSVADANDPTTTVEILDDTHVTANFEVNSYNLNVSHTGSGSTVPDGDSNPDYGDLVDLTASPASGWYFDGWTGDPVADSADPTTRVTIMGNTTVAAVFLPIPPGDVTLTIDVDGQGITTPSVGDHVVSEGTVVTLSAEAAPCWEFIRWDGPVASSGQATTTVLVNDDILVTAVFHYSQQCLFTVDTDEAPPEGGTTSGGIVDAQLETPFIVEAMANQGWNFDGWSTNGSTIVITDNPYEGSVIGNETYTAHFSTPPTVYYTLDIDSIGPGYTVPSEGSHQYPSGAIVSLEVHPYGPAGYFDKWVGTDGSAVYYDGGYKIRMTGDREIIALFDSEMEMFELIVRIDGNGEVEVSSGGSVSTVVTSIKTFYVPSGATVYMIPDADSGHYFDEWNGPDQSDVYSEGGGEYSIYMDEDKEIEAEFNERSTPGPIIIRHRLRITIEGNGTVDPFVGSQTYTPGTDVSVTADPGAGWTFEGWFGPDGGDVIDGVIDMDEDKSIIARFVQSPTPPPIEPPEIIIPLVETPLGDGDLPDTGQAFPVESLGIGLILMMVGTLTRKKDDQ
jgi:hypothetical protein